MSTPDVDSDMGRWPENPYDLLGVSFGVSPRDLRRAYTRLIRQYKPEQFPEHFKRIRAAYEAILRDTEMAGSCLPEAGTNVEFQQPSMSLDEEYPAEGPPGSAGTSSASSHFPEQQHLEESVRADLPPRPILLGLEEELDGVWERACRGEEEQAYHQLRDLFSRHPGHKGVCARLYWLLTLYPHLDLSSSPCDVLSTGLRANGLTGNLLELYRREIKAVPAEAISERCTQLLECSVSAGLITSLVEWRWQAANLLEKWDIIREDVQRLRLPILREGEETWVRLLVLAITYLTWAPDPTSRLWAQRYYQEIERYPHLSSRLVDDLDRLEFLRGVSTDWLALKARRELPPAWTGLIPLSWTHPFPEIRQKMEDFVVWVAQNPFDALRRFDLINDQSSKVLVQFGNLLRQYQSEMEVVLPAGNPSPVVTRLILDFLTEPGPQPYRVLRPRVVEFCLREHIPPRVIVKVMRDNPTELGHTKTQVGVLDDDLPVHYVFLAYQLYWS